MAKYKNKLELTWIGKDKRPKLEPRILLEESGKSYHAKHRVTNVRWCQLASDYLLKHAGKEWKYLLVPHDEVKEQNTLSTYRQKYEIR